MTKAVAEAEKLGPDVVLLSLSLPDITPFEACQEITAASPGCRVITFGLAPVSEGEVAITLMVASRHLPKGTSRRDFVRVVRAAGAGEVLDIAAVAEKMLRFLRAFPRRVNLGSLTDVEKRTFVLISEGLTNTQIGQRTGISAHSVRSRVSRILRKLNVSSRAGLGIYCPMIEILRDDADR